MNRYNESCNVVFDFLNEIDACYSTRWLYRNTFDNFGEFLKANDTTISLNSVEKWLNCISDTKNSDDILRCRLILLRLYDVWEFGHIMPGHIQNGSYYYSKLTDDFSDNVDIYLDSRRDEVQKDYITALKTSLSYFLYYCQSNGCQTLKDITYDHLFSFSDESSGIWSEKSKKWREGHVSDFLLFWAEKKVIGHGLSLVYANNCVLPWIIRWKEISNKNQDILLQEKQKDEDFDSETVYSLIKDFKEELVSASYSRSVISNSVTVIEFLSLFLDMHDLPYTFTVSDVFFDELSKRDIISIKAIRRALWLFKDFTEFGFLNSSKKFSYQPVRLDLLPDWCKTVIIDFLELKRSEGMSASTICMYRSACVKFCDYLVNEGFSDFMNLKAQNIVDFNLQDKHATVEGKNAYNIRIRKFIDYLAEEKLIQNPLLSKALLTNSARAKHIIEILNAEEIEAIRRPADINNKPELRDKAMVSLGLFEGLRGSDVVGLKFSDIDWKNRTISIVQKKTARAVVLPLTSEAGNALYRYIRYARPDYERNGHIFISFKAPHAISGRSTCQDAINRILPHRKNSRSGFHILRKTYASRLLYGGSSISGVSEALGHTGNSTVHEYLNLDENRIRMCCLSLNETGLELSEELFRC